MKDSNQIEAVSRYETQLESLRRRQAWIQAEIAGAGTEILDAERRRDAAVARLLPVTTELSDKLRLVKTMEEDLVAAKKRQVDIQSQLTAMAALDKKVLAAAKLKADVAAVDAELAKSQEILKQKAGALSALRQTLTELAALEARVQKQIAGTPTKDAAKGPAKTPPKK